MKRIFFLLLLCLVPVRAYGTTVSVAAQQIAGFQPASIGNDVSLTVTATNGSTAITCAACFRQQWVGLGGYTVSLAGTLYTVSSVNTTSSATLTANYAGVTSASTAAIFYRYIEVRFYSNISFLPLGSSSIVQAGTPNSGAFFKRFAASVVLSGGVSTLYIPAFTLDSTTDSADNNTARYTIGMYRPDGSFIQFYTCSPNMNQLRIPPTTPTSLRDICVFNSQPVVNRDPNTFYTIPQINALLPSCSSGQMVYFSNTGRAQSCLTVGSGLSIAGGTITSTGGGNTMIEDVASLPVTCTPSADTLYRTPDGALAYSLWMCTQSSGVYVRLDNNGYSGGDSGATGSVAAGGGNTQVQFNNVGVLGGISGFTTDGTNVTAGSGNLRATSPRITTDLSDANGNEVFKITATGSAVNEYTVANAAAAGLPTISLTGGDTNISGRFTTKGTGGWYFRPGSNSANAFVIENAAGNSIARFDTASNYLGLNGQTPAYTIDSGANTTDIIRLGKMLGGAWVGVDSTWLFLQNSNLSIASGNYALSQNGSGATQINAASGQSLFIKVGNASAITINSDQSATFAGTTFGSLGTPSNGTLRYCTDCTIANPCAGGGTGALAKRLNGVWVCN